MAVSNSTTLNDLVGQIVSDEAQSAAYSARVMRNLVTVKEVPLGAGSIVMPRFQKLTEGALTEETATTSTQWSSDGVTLTPVERGIYVQISKRVLHADPFSDLAPYGEQLGKALAEGDNAELAAKFAPVAKALVDNEAKIIEELLAVEGKAQDIGGYFRPDDAKAEAAMRPSATLNAIIDAI